MTTNSVTLDLEPLSRLSRDLKQAAGTLTDKEVRYLVDFYYQIQGYRKAAAQQESAAIINKEPASLMFWMYDNMRILENDVKRGLDSYTDSHEVGVWLKSITGIGPVIAAGLLAHVDIAKAPTAGAVWRFAGLDPSVTWGKGERRPWNAKLKTLCWLAGQSFVKTSNHPNSFYGPLYKQRKEYEQTKNEAGEYADQAKAKLEKFNIGKTTDAYKWYSEGKLPPAHIQARVERWTVKLFLAHFHEFYYEWHFGVPAPNPYVFEHLGHVHRITRPV